MDERMVRIGHRPAHRTCIHGKKKHILLKCVAQYTRRVNAREIALYTATPGSRT